MGVIRVIVIFVGTHLLSDAVLSGGSTNNNIIFSTPRPRVAASLVPTLHTYNIMSTAVRTQTDDDVYIISSNIL